MYAQISPSRFTTAPHILLPSNRPPAVGLEDARIAARSSAAVGTSLQFAANAFVAEHRTNPRSTPTIFFIAFPRSRAPGLRAALKWLESPGAAGLYHTR